MATARQVHRHVLADPAPPLPRASHPDEASARTRHMAAPAARERRDDETSTWPVKLMRIAPSSLCTLGGLAARAPHAWSLRPADADVGSLGQHGNPGQDAQGHSDGTNKHRTT